MKSWKERERNLLEFGTIDPNSFQNFMYYFTLHNNALIYGTILHKYMILLYFLPMKKTSNPNKLTLYEVKIFCL